MAGGVCRLSSKSGESPPHIRGTKRARTLRRMKSILQRIGSALHPCAATPMSSPGSLDKTAANAFGQVVQLPCRQSSNIIDGGARADLGPAHDFEYEAGHGARTQLPTLLASGAAKLRAMESAQATCRNARSEPNAKVRGERSPAASDLPVPWWVDLVCRDGEQDAEAYVRDVEAFQQEAWSLSGSSPRCSIPSPRQLQENREMKDIRGPTPSGHCLVGACVMHGHRRRGLLRPWREVGRARTFAMGLAPTDDVPPAITAFTCTTCRGQPI
mmetsp:Transcript_7152/g.17821  ORF Transcript_7152/g.17821 Transcript_7152/m.17821 type:complete len:271 (-) Transcript_7152:328-1140(-)